MNIFKKIFKKQVAPLARREITHKPADRRTGGSCCHALSFERHYINYSEKICWHCKKTFKKGIVSPTVGKVLMWYDS